MPDGLLPNQTVGLSERIPGVGNVPLNRKDVKYNLKKWLTHEVGETLGPNGMHVPLPAFRPVPHCALCPDPAVEIMWGWRANRTQIEVPLCANHGARAHRTVNDRRKELMDRDDERRRRAQ